MLDRPRVIRAWHGLAPHRLGNFLQETVTLATRIHVHRVEGILNLRASQIDLPWLARGQPVSISIGSGRNEGLLRLRRDGPLELVGMIGRANKIPTNVRVIFVPPQWWQLPAGPTALGWDIEDGDLVMALPGWARRAADQNRR